jgi:hypothetical protein
MNKNNKTTSKNVFNLNVDEEINQNNIINGIIDLLLNADCSLFESIEIKENYVKWILKLFNLILILLTQFFELKLNQKEETIAKLEEKPEMKSKRQRDAAYCMDPVDENDEPIDEKSVNAYIAIVDDLYDILKIEEGTTNLEALQISANYAK